MKRALALAAMPATLTLLQGCAAIPMAAQYMGHRHMDARLSGELQMTAATRQAAALTAAAGRAPAPGRGSASIIARAHVAAADFTNDLPEAQSASQGSDGANGSPSRVYVSDQPKRKRRAQPAAPRPQAPVPAGMQYLYGSGEAAALEYQAFIGLENYLLGVTSDRAVGHIVHSVVLAPGATLANPTFLPCDQKPMAVVFDIDETTIFNLGFEQATLAAGGGYSADRWDQWEKSGSSAVSLVPGVKEAIKVARDANVEVIFNSNRSTANADKTAAMLNELGVGPVAYGTNLWLKGDSNSTGNGKDARRQDISVRYCVVAMVGDQLGDFTDLFNANDISLSERRDLTGSKDIYLMWGHGWFLLPNSAYGTGLNGTQDEIFPRDKRWTPGSSVYDDPVKEKK